MIKKKIIWELHEDDYIEKYYLVKSDEEIAKELNKTKSQITSRRLKLGFKKQRQTFHKEIIDGMKWCWHCNKFQPLDEFSKNKNKPDGYQDECKRAVKEIILNRKILEKKKKKQNNISNKTCSKCNINKNISAFVKNSSTIDGYSNLCRECLNENNTKKYKMEDK